MKKKLAEKIEDYFIEQSLAKVTIILITVYGISVFSIVKLTRGVLNYQVILSVSDLLGIFLSLTFIILLAWYIRLKFRSKRKFEEGAEVILTTGHAPVMSAGKYNFLNNKICCTWSHEQRIKHEWINQNLLKEYEKSELPRIVKRSSEYWSRNRW